MLYAFVLAILTFSFFHLVWRRQRAAGKGYRRDAPEPDGAWPVVGHIPLLANNKLMHRHFAELAEKHGPAFSLRVGWRRILVVSSWELAKECFSNNDRAFAGRPQMLASQHVGMDSAFLPLAEYGPYWRETRKLMVHNALSNRMLDSLQRVWISELEIFVGKIYSRWLRDCKTQMEMKDELMGTLLNITTRIVAGKRFYGTEAGDAEAKQFFHAFDEMLYLLGVQDVGDAFPFLRRFDLAGHEKKMKKNRAEIERLMQKWVDDHRQNEKSGGDDADEQDLVGTLLAMDKKGALPNKYSTDHFIKAFSNSVTLAATDTTAATLTWAMSELANNRQAVERAQAELDAHVGRDRVVETTDIGKLVYIHSIVKETLRLHPPAPLLGPHQSLEDCEVGGFHVRADTTLLVNAWKIHRDPRNFADPLRFRPERFLEENKEIDLLGQQCMLLPFSSGRRACPGSSLALRVLHFTLARLLQAFEWGIPGGASEVDLIEGEGITANRKTPLHLVVTPRLSPSLYQR